MMNRDQSRLLATGSFLVRQLCSASAEAVSETAAPKSMGNGPVLYRRLSALGATGGSVSQTLNDCVMEGKMLRKDELVRCIKQLRLYHRYNDALEIMKWMEKRKMNFSIADHAICLDLIAKNKGIAAAENYFSKLSPSAQNQSTYGALLNCYCKELMTEKALTLFEKMDQLNFVSHSLPFNNLITMFLRLGKPEKVSSLVDQMKKRKISPCNYTYTVWMQSCASLNDIDGMERVFDEMEKYCNEKCNWSTYSNLASIYVKAKLFEKAELALKKLEEMKPRNREAYHFLISLYSHTSNLDAVNRVWSILKSAFPKTNSSYLVMLQALAKLDAIDLLKKCFDEWEASCSSYDMRLANVAIRAYLSKDMYEEASSVFNNAMQRSKGYYSKARESFMIYYLRTCQLDLAMEEMETAASEAKEYGWCPKQETVSVFFNFFKEQKDVDGAEEFFKVLKVLNCLDSNVYNLLMRTYIAAGKLASEMRRRLEEDDIEITHELEDLLLKVCSIDFK